MARSGRLRARHRNGIPQKRTPKAVESLVNSRGMTRSPKQLDIRPPPFAVVTNAQRITRILPGRLNICSILRCTSEIWLGGQSGHLSGAVTPKGCRAIPQKVDCRRLAL